jgi:hypothetical protein
MDRSAVSLLVIVARIAASPTWGLSLNLASTTTPIRTFSMGPTTVRQDGFRNPVLTFSALRPHGSPICCAYAKRSASLKEG